MLRGAHCVRMLYLYLYSQDIWCKMGRSAILLLLVLNLLCSSSSGVCLFHWYMVYGPGVSSIILCLFCYCPIPLLLTLHPTTPFSRPFLSCQAYLHLNYIFKSTVNISIHISHQYITIIITFCINIGVMPQNFTKLSKVKWMR